MFPEVGLRAVTKQIGGSESKSARARSSRRNTRKRRAVVVCVDVNIFVEPTNTTYFSLS